MTRIPDNDAPLGGLRILVADDEVLIALDLSETLSEAGADVVGPCSTLSEALAAAEAESLSLAVLDVRLGRTTTAKVAVRLGDRGIPYVFYSGQALPDDMRALWPEVEMLMKPSRAATNSWMPSPGWSAITRIPLPE